MSFELKFFVCRHVSIRGFRNRVCLYVRTPRKEITLASSISRHGNPKIRVFSKKDEIEFRLVPKCWNQSSFVNISPTVVIGTWIARFSRVLQHGNLKIYFLFEKMLTLVFLLYCFVNNFYLILCTLMGLLSNTINKHSSRSQHISRLTTCTFVFTI